MIHKKDNPTSQCKLKFASDETGVFEGYASVFNSNDAVGDTIVPGAFTRSLEKGLFPLFINHDHNDIPFADCIAAKQDDYGLLITGRVDMNHHMGPSAHSAMKREAMNGLSIGFTMTPEDFDRKDGGGRVIKNVDLKEVSLVTYPCEDSARLTDVKSEDIEVLECLKDCERFLRDSRAFSKSAATAFVSRVKSLVLSDSVAACEKSQRNVTNEVMEIIRRVAK